jgi:1-acyl-sn-glycerol-3-phosphate acyltransferase
MQNSGHHDLTSKVLINKNSMLEKTSIFAKYTKKRLAIQKFISFIVLIPFFYSLIFIFKYILKYKIENVKFIRHKFKKLVKQKKPLIICPNHLTFIDSCLIIWALATPTWYIFNFRYFSWNLPAGDFFGKKLRYRIIAFIAKCIFIHRDADSSHHNEILNICQNLLSKGEILTIFPEGKRSRTGKFESKKLTYGVGKILQGVPDCNVLCIYLRGDKQEIYSNYPSRSSRFYMNMELISPKTSLQGREGYADLIQQISSVIKEQENQYFSLKKEVSINNYESIKINQREQNT